MAVLEAMAADLPVVTSDLPVFHEYLTDGVDALMTPTRDVPALAEALTRVANSSELRARLVDNAHSVVERFSWQRSAARHQEIYAAHRVGARV